MSETTKTGKELIVHNSFIDLPFHGLSGIQIDIVLGILFMVHENGVNEMEIPYYELNKNTGSQKNLTLKDFEENINKIFNFFRENILYYSGPEGNFKMVLFPTLKSSADKRSASVFVNQQYLYLVNHYIQGYTKLELEESNSLKSVYSKQIYQKLRKFRRTGEWYVSQESFKFYIGIKEENKQSNIDRIIKRAETELSPFFKDLRVEKVYEIIKTENTSRKIVAGYSWRFEAEKAPENTTKINSSDSTDIIASKLGYTPTGRYCPNCGKKVYEKKIYFENGEYRYTIWGHPDFKTGGCNWSTNDFADTLENDPNTVEEKNEEGIRKRDEMLSSIFGPGTRNGENN